MNTDKNNPGCFGSFILYSLAVIFVFSLVNWTLRGCSNVITGESFSHENRFIETDEIETTYSESLPPVAENGDIRGADNDGDGRPEPVFVRGYYRSDGTYVRSHYRAAHGE